MEDYDQFAFRRFSRPQESQDEPKAPSTASLIRFHGRSILPPVLSEEQKQEMQQHREAAQKVHRRLEDHRRRARVESILLSVQLRSTPTLVDLLQEMQMDPGSSSSRSNSIETVLRCTRTRLSLSPPSVEIEQDCPSYSVQQGSSPDQQSGHKALHLRGVHGNSHSSASSGFGSPMNVMGGAGQQSHFFFHSTSTSAIISHPPIDGEELERSGLTSTCDRDFLEEDSAISDDGPAKKAENADVDSSQDHAPFPAGTDASVDAGSDRMETGPDPSQTFTTRLWPLTEADKQVGGSGSSQEPYRLSLHALLKKSQEYRRNQRMLRNQAKSTKFHQRAQEPVEEQNLSDKENHEFPSKGDVTGEGRKTKDRRGGVSPAAEPFPKLCLENERTIDDCEQVKPKAEGAVTDTGETAGAEQETTRKNNKLNVCQGVRTNPRQPFLQRPPVSAESCDQEEQSTHCPPAPGHSPLQGDTLRRVFEGDGTILAKQSQHLDQLESNLCSLKVVISDLESTLTDDLESQCRAERTPHGALCCPGIERAAQTETEQQTTGQSGCDAWEEAVGNAGTDEESADTGRPPELLRGSRHSSGGPLPQELQGVDRRGGSRVKRRLLMCVPEEANDGGGPGCEPTPRGHSPPTARGGDGQEGRQQPLSAAPVRSLRQQEPLLQPSGSVLELYRPLLVAAAAVKGFLTRRLLRTSRVVELVRTVRDTERFLQAFHHPNRGEVCSRQDFLLQNRVALQLRAARYEVHDIFFSLSVGERMKLISWDRELERERELRRQAGFRGKTSLSAATQKSLERKRGIIIHKKAAEHHRGVVASVRRLPEGRRGHRVLRSTTSFRPR